jgi:bifunctional oligoribonuclease and PAP phosphatase NrnA
MSRREVRDLVRHGARFLVTCHRRPDGDALGSALGLAAILRALGKHADVYVPEEIPFSLAFMPRVADVLAVIGRDARYDATFVTDTAAPSLLPQPFPDERVRGTLVVVDHHVSHDHFGDLALREVDACATGEVVLRFMRDLGLERIPPDAATPLYTAIVADTGGFRYATTKPHTLRLAAELLEAGAEPWNVAYHLFEGWAPERLALLREVLATMRVELEGALAILDVERATMAKVGATPDMVEGLVTYGRRLRGVEIAALLWEIDEDGPAVRISLRSRADADVSLMAEALGGGGHRAAAGATFRGGLVAARARVVEEAEKILRAPRR